MKGTFACYTWEDMVMDKQVSTSKLGAINWAAMLAPAKSSEAATGDTKPVNGTGKAAPSDPPIKSTKDQIDLSVPKRGASGAAVREQVMRIDGEISSLTKALTRNQESLAEAHEERAELSEALARKLKRADELKSDLLDVRGEKARLQAEIAAIAEKIDEVDAKIDVLKAEQEDLLKRELVLTQKHREQYFEAHGARDYAEYLKTLPGYAQGDDALAKAREEAASKEARKAEERLHAIEGKLTETNTRQAVITLEGYFLNLRLGKLQAQGEAKEGELDATEKRLAQLEGQQERLQGKIAENREQLAKVDAEISKTEKTISTIERKIADLEALRDEVLADAIKARQQDAKAIADKIAELEEAIQQLKGELRSTRKDLQELKDLRASYDK